MLMKPRTPDPNRPIEGTTIRTAVERLARRVVRESGGTTLRALADIRASVDAAICEQIDAADGDQPGATTARRRSWRAIGDDLGVTAQAAHRKYRRRAEAGPSSPSVDGPPSRDAGAGG
jgi:hypothetical protein